MCSGERSGGGACEGALQCCTLNFSLSTSPSLLLSITSFSGMECLRDVLILMVTRSSIVAHTWGAHEA